MYQEQHHTQPLPGVTAREQMYAELAPTEVLPALPAGPGQQHGFPGRDVIDALTILSGYDPQVVKAYGLIAAVVDDWEARGMGADLDLYIARTHGEENISKRNLVQYRWAHDPIVTAAGTLGARKEPRIARLLGGAP